jgi:hypothetical protein
LTSSNTYKPNPITMEGFWPFSVGLAQPNLPEPSLSDDRRPRSDSAEFSKAWQSDSADVGFLNEGIRRWREQSRTPRGT